MQERGKVGNGKLGYLIPFLFVPCGTITEALPPTFFGQFVRQVSLLHDPAGFRARPLRDVPVSTYAKSGCPEESQFQISCSRKLSQHIRTPPSMCPPFPVGETSHGGDPPKCELPNQESNSFGEQCGGYLNAVRIPVMQPNVAHSIPDILKYFAGIIAVFSCVPRSP